MTVQGCRVLLASRVSRSENRRVGCELQVACAYSVAKFLVTSSAGFGGRNPATPPKSPRREWARDPPGQKSESRSGESKTNKYYTTHCARLKRQQLFLSQGQLSTLLCTQKCLTTLFNFFFYSCRTLTCLDMIRMTTTSLSRMCEQI